ncbi:hypothetical protein ONZ45_g14348 [Pleurotus djamor]|nr:hypothetical protein ONZ45_g14348 [Pleurotus djamor]
MTNDVLDVFGQQPALNIYTQITLCYPLPDTDPTAPSHIVDTLKKGLEKLGSSFPWVASQVVNEGATQENSGVFKFKPLEGAPRLTIIDYRDDPAVPSMEDLRKAGFPAHMLDENIVAPMNTLPLNPEDLKERPVLLVQANFIKGGVLLTVNGHHGALDMTSQTDLMSLLGKACRDEEFTSEDLALGNVPRADAIPLLDDFNVNDPAFAHQVVKPVTVPPTDPTLASTPPPKSLWCYFLFSGSSLKNLKASALKSTALPEGGYFSTDDVLTALIWQAVARTRLARLDPEIKVRLGRAVDARRYLDLPPRYPGVAQNMAYSAYASARALSQEPLGNVAYQLRLAIDPKTSNMPYACRAFATLLHRAQHKSTIGVTANFDYSTDVQLSSWSQVPCYDLDFGLGLGKPEAVRRPQFFPVENLFYLMPKKGDGEVAVLLGLREDDLETLKRDEEFMKYATFIG